MQIGELARRTGASVRSLRYYEAQRLLAPERTASGHRRYRTVDVVVVARIRELLAAGFCSTVIRELLPAMTDPDRARDALVAAFDAARARLLSERRAIDGELLTLARLAADLGLESHTHVTSDTGLHDDFHRSAPTPLDHRDRRLR